MNRRREQTRQERSENTKVKITDLSHRHTILFKVQYVHPYTYTCVHLYTAHTGTNTYSASICMHVRTLVARTVKGLGYTLYVSLYRARSTFVLDNEYIRHGIWIGVSRLLCDRRWECAELIATPERPGFRIYRRATPSRERGGEGFQLSPPCLPRKCTRKKHGVN